MGNVLVREYTSTLESTWVDPPSPPIDVTNNGNGYTGSGGQSGGISGGGISYPTNPASLSWQARLALLALIESRRSQFGSSAYHQSGGANPGSATYTYTDPTTGETTSYTFLEGTDENGDPVIVVISTSGEQNPDGSYTGQNSVHIGSYKL